MMYLTMPGFAGDGRVVHAFSTREGGRSRPPFFSLNLAFHVGDDPETVLENRRIFFQAVGLSLDRSTWARQVHENQVVVVDQSKVGAGSDCLDTALPHTDGMITNLPGVSLGILTADCLPVLIYDPKKRAVAAVHAGWRGVLSNLPVKTIELMSKTYGTRPQDCQVALGPGIAKCCFQVGRDVQELFIEKMPLITGQIFSQAENGVYLDLYQACSLNLQGIGVSAKNIFDSSICTSCRPSQFFSYRAEKGKTGRMASVIGLLE